MSNNLVQGASNVHWQAQDIDQAARALLKQQQPQCIWFTGLSGSGKSTLANLLEKRLYAAGRHTCLLDGDNLRHGLNRDLGFTDADRVENIRRVAEVSRLMVSAGLIVLAMGRYGGRALDRSAQFPPLLIDMVNVGEQTGDMPAALTRAAERFDRELSKKIDTLAALIQPLIVCLMAAMVGLMAYLMMTTIFQTISSINK